MARRRFFTDSLNGGTTRLEGAAADHLSRVLRAQPGQEYELAIQGELYLGRVTRVSPRTVEFTILVQLAEARPEAPLELAAALFKFDRWEWMLEKATELGVTRIWPLTTRRSDPHLAAAAGKRAARWRQIVRQASEQSRRATEPGIASAQDLEAALAQPFHGARICLSESPADAPAFAASPPMRLLLGPEGGWAPEESSAVLAAGYAPASLGGQILRCETAALAALARAAAPSR
ncbi:MAG: RsmE family RNA methyltransferase [Terriglobales bacterium]